MLQQLTIKMFAARRTADPAANGHLGDTRADADITLAKAGAVGTSGDGADAIHLTPAGCRKCTVAWADVLDPILG